MKEAAGEANMTVVTIILIAAIVAVATPIITSMMSTFGKRACCMDAGGYWKDNACVGVTDYWDESTKSCSTKNGTNNGGGYIQKGTP